jgi:SAM-dependent methyltransferase
MVQPVTCYGNLGNKEVISAIPADAGKILDLGCGAGAIAKLAQSGGAIWDGITISSEEADSARSAYRKIVLHNLEKGLPAADLDNDYDVCVCSHVIEHLVWPERLLHDICRLLEKSSGILIMAVPNFVNHEVRFKIARGKFEYRQSGILDINHVRWYTFKSARRLLVENGFSVERAWAQGDFPIGKRFRKRIPVSLMDHVDRLACRMFPGFFGHQLIYVAKSAG